MSDHATEALVSTKNVAVAVTMLADEVKARDARIAELEAGIRDALGRHQVTHIHASLRRLLGEEPS